MKKPPDNLKNQSNTYQSRPRNIPGIPPSNVLDLRQIAIKKTKKDYSDKKENKKEKELREKIAAKQKAKQEKALLKQKNKAELKAQKKSKTKIEIPKKPKRKIEFKKFISLPSWKLSVKPLSLFLTVCLILILPLACFALYHKLSDIKNSVLSLSQQALEDIKIGGQLASDFNFEEASTQFNDAMVKFSTAQDDLNDFNKTVAVVIELLPGKGEKLKSAKGILEAGKNLASAAKDFTLAFNILSKLDASILDQVNRETKPSLTEIIVLSHANLKPASEKIDKAAKALKEVDPNVLPEKYKNEIALIQQELPNVNASLKQILNLSESMLAILGHDQPKRYLVVFQNNREIRATGGFLGSFGLIDINKGKVTKMVIPGGGTYDLNGALKANIISPEPLHLVNPVWQIQDANWWPDWPTSAQKIEWFYNQSDGPTVDGVLALTPDVIEDILRITGPEDMTEEYGVVITADNFYDVIQTEAEKKYDETKESKKIIADLTPKLLNHLFSLEKSNALSVLKIFYNALQEKNILLYFNDPELEQEMINLGWSGSIKQTNGDYLSVINTNISGGKTDAVIEETINHQAQILEDGSIVDTVNITRTHKGHVDDNFTNDINWDYLRVYVPEGSQLVSASGFVQPDKNDFIEVPTDKDYTLDNDLKNISGDIFVEENTKMRINKEFGKTVFGNWVKVGPGESKTVTISYRLPFKLETDGFLNNVDTYSLLIQKQPGSFNSFFHTQLMLSDNYEYKWRYPTNFNGHFETILDTDKYLGVVIENKT